jgi:hypothetical protein
VRQSSEAFPGLDHECRREVFGPEPRFYMIVSADSFSNRTYTNFFRSHDLKRCLAEDVIENDQKAIIKFPTNESVDTHEICMRLRAQFGEQTTPCARSNSVRARYNAAEKTSMVRIAWKASARLHRHKDHLHIGEGAFRVYTFNCPGPEQGSCNRVASFARYLIQSRAPGFEGLH